ncbi:zinc-binding dehydrogenase [Stomatohabitans albus]|uniref:zinc-binding dehydrogenase n=1 Tax=Stomatohabitans albus TaxID=3110766 RepID=UPI00300C63D3
MRAVVFDGPGDLNLKEVPDPVMGHHDILIAPTCTTLCGTDVRIVRGEKTSGIRKGIILGHEIAGKVVGVGSGVTGWQEGDRVSVLPLIGCGRCTPCVTGNQQMCVHPELFSYDLDGSLADLMLIPERALARGSVVRINSSVPAPAAALAEPLACILTGVAACGLTLGEDVLILGAGPIGLLWTQVAKAAGANRIIVTNRGWERRNLALAMGATHAIDPTDIDLAEAVHELTDGNGVDLAVLAIGVPSLMNDALRCTKNLGRVSAFAGFPKDSTATIDANLIHYNQIAVYGASNSGPYHHRRAVQFIESGVIDTARLVTHNFGLDAIHRALEVVANREGVKVAITP